RPEILLARRHHRRRDIADLCLCGHRQHSAGGRRRPDCDSPDPQALAEHAPAVVWDRAEDRLRLSQGLVEVAWSGSRMLDRPERLAWLRLIRTDNIGPQTFRQLLRREGSVAEAIEALPALTRPLGFTPRIPSSAEAEDEL